MVAMIDLGVSRCKDAPDFSYEAVLDVNQVVEVAFEAYQVITLVFPELNQGTGTCDFLFIICEKQLKLIVQMFYNGSDHSSTGSRTTFSNIFKRARKLPETRRWNER